GWELHHGGHADTGLAGPLPDLRDDAGALGVLQDAGGLVDHDLDEWLSAGGVEVVMSPALAALVVDPGAAGAAACPRVHLPLNALQHAADLGQGSGEDVGAFVLPVRDGAAVLRVSQAEDHVPRMPDLRAQLVD